MDAMDKLSSHLKTRLVDLRKAKEESTLKYYLHGITRLKARLEALTGVKITESKLREAISSFISTKERPAYPCLL